MQSNAIYSVTAKAPSNATVTARRAVGFNGAQATTQGQRCLGIAQYGAAANGDYAVDVLGTAEWDTGGQIALGDPLMTDNQGRCVVATALAATVAAGATAVTSGAANGAGIVTLAGAVPPVHIVGYAMQAASGAGGFIEVLLGR